MSTSQYSKEFREKAVRMVLITGKAASEVGRELGVPDWNIRDWVRSAKRKESQNQDKSSKSHPKKMLN
jgi:transposase-like protein